MIIMLSHDNNSNNNSNVVKTQCLTDLSDLPPVTVLPVHLSDTELSELFEILKNLHAPVTFDYSQAQVVIGNINNVTRVKMELRRFGCLRTGVSFVNSAWLSSLKKNNTLQNIRNFTIYEHDDGDVSSMSKQSLELDMKRPHASNHEQESNLVKKQRVAKRGNSAIDAIFLKRYACERPHPLECVNQELVIALTKVRLVRQLENNEVSIRAYSSAIASIKSYPEKITSIEDVKGLTGCGGKVSKLVQEYLNTGNIESELFKLETLKFQAIQQMYNIWGVGSRTANDWYNKFGWRNEQDVKEHGWDSLSKSQKAGINYYQEFKQKLSHEQVKYIGNKIQDHATMIEPKALSVICGSYRRGAISHSDVDIIIGVPGSMPGEQHEFLAKLLKQLKIARLICDVLSGSSLNHESSDSKKKEPKSRLDLAFIVWSTIPEVGAQVKYYRVDIICVDWSIMGPAVVGWTGATTFERDLRLYAKNKGLKFNSDGLTNRETGELIDTTADSIEASEKKVFEVLGLPYFDPTLRNTG
ncbi:hypothetical protein V1514DRAFT_338357 [Lipomyces japonicus]|uniref:uncharacterized protein n=1 Tax=Lipomyces japonicus TaxID=56871 RepID=UPI0034CD6A51